MSAHTLVHREQAESAGRHATPTRLVTLDWSSFGLFGAILAGLLALVAFVLSGMLGLW